MALRGSAAAVSTQQQKMQVPRLCACTTSLPLWASSWCPHIAFDLWNLLAVCEEYYRGIAPVKRAQNSVAPAFSSPNRVLKGEILK
jgi:hypothetical protein